MTDAQPDPTAPADEALLEIIEQYHQRIDSGESVDREVFVAEHPEHRDGLLSYFDDVHVVEGLAGPTIDSATEGTMITGETHSDAYAETMVESSQSDTSNVRVAADAPRTKFGRYRLLKELGRGAMGAVYLAHDEQLDREIALKIPQFGPDMNPALLERFYREARAAAALRHPGICPVFDVGQIDGQHYITMAFIKGRPLRDFTKTTKTQGIRQVVRVIRKLALAMAEAHKHNVTHRDLKPANVMIDERKEPVVMDFGLARRAAEGEEKLTHSGTVIGTPAYMSPEQVDGDNDRVGPPADIYSLGVMFYEMLTGQLPFQGNLMSILKQIANDEPQPPAELRAEVPAELEAVCLKMMAKQIEDRYQSMEQVAAALSDFLKQKNAGTEESGVLETSKPPAVHPKVVPIIEATEPVTVPPAPQPAPVETSLPSITPDLSATTVRPPRRSSGGLEKRKLLIACGLGGAALLLAGIVFIVQLGKVTVQITVDDPSLALKVDGDDVVIEGDGAPIRLSAGTHELIVKRDGLEFSPKEFKVTKDGKNVIHVAVVDDKVQISSDGKRLPASNPSKEHNHGNDPDRALARWALSIGSRVTTSLGPLSPGDAIPSEPFHIESLAVAKNKAVTDDDLKLVRRCEKLDQLYIASTLISDAGFAHLRGHPSLRLLNAGNTKVTDTGLRYLQEMPALRELYLPLVNGVTDQGLQHLKDVKLDRIGILSSRVTPAGIAAFQQQHPGCVVNGLSNETTTPLPVADAGQVDLKRGLVAHWNFEEGKGSRVADLSGNGNHGTLNWDDPDTAWTSDSPPTGLSGGRCITVREESQLVTASDSPSLDLTEALTVSVWIRFLNKDKHAPELVSKGGSVGYRLLAGGQFLLGNPNPKATVNHWGSMPADGRWHHLLAMYDGKLMSVYRDGALIDQQTRSGSIAANDRMLEVGARDHDDSIYSIDDVRLYNRALSESEIAVLAGKARLPESVTPPAVADTGSWRPVFDGKTLDGWELFGGKSGDWEVVDGVLTCKGERNRLVYTRETYDDFDVRVECRLDNVVNSGVYLRTDKSEDSGEGYEAQLAFASTKMNGGCYVGGLFRFALFKESLVGPDEWFTLEAHCRGPKITLFVNGKQTIEFEDPAKRFAAGHIALNTWDGGVAEFRKIEVRTDAQHSQNAAADVVDLKRGLVGHWNFEENDERTFWDESGGQNHARLPGNSSASLRMKDAPPVSLAGEGCLTLTDKPDHLMTPIWQGLDLEEGLTLAGWARCRDPNVNLFTARNVIEKNTDNEFRLAVDGYFTFRTGPDAGHVTVQLESDSDIPRDRWYHLAATWDRSVMRVYLDGELKRTRSYSGDIVLSDKQVRLGRQGGAVRPAPYSIDDVRLYTRALNEAEIAVLAGKAALPRDSAREHSSNGGSSISQAELLTSPDWMWSAPARLPEPVNSQAFEGGPSFSSDGNMLVFGRSSRNGSEGGLMVSTRSSSGEWSSPRPLGEEIKSYGRLGEPHLIVGEGKQSLYLDGYAGDAGIPRLWVTHRESVASPWSKPESLGNAFDGDFQDQAPSLSADGCVIVFHAHRRKGVGKTDIFVSSRPTADAEWSTPIHVGSQVNTKGAESHPCLSSDGLVLMFLRAPIKGASQQLWRSVRRDRDSAWESPVEVRFSNGFSGTIRQPALSPDGRTLIFSNGSDLLVSGRVRSNE